MTMTLARPTARAVLPLAALCLGLALPALLLTLRDAAGVLPLGRWPAALLSPDLADPAELLARHALGPRILVSMLAGAALAFAGTLLTQALRNPLAEAATLGTAAGASLALTAATLFAPALLSAGREWVALAGGAAATALSFALASGRGFSPVRLILSGLVVTLTAGSAAATLMALKSDYVSEVFVWQSGSLLQNGDGVAKALAWQLALAILASLPLVRALAIIGIDDRAGAALGLSPTRVRLGTVAIGVVLAAAVTAGVGVVAFLGVAAPALARFVGARTFKARLVVAPILGALMLWLTDRLVSALSTGLEIPAGAATAVFGAPLILALLPRVRSTLPRAEEAPPATRRAPPRLLLAIALAILALVLLTLGFGRSLSGWSWLGAAQWADILPLRAPRVVAAAGAGLLLGAAGAILQRVTGNPMASPELLGVSGGATLGVLALMLASPMALGPVAAAVSAGTGAALATGLVLGLGLRRGAAPERLLLAGFFVSTFASSLAAAFLASGDPRAQWLQTWLTGSTYLVSGGQAASAALAGLTVLALLPLAARWLAILPLGAPVAAALGLPVAASRAALVSLAAVSTALAVLVVGPLSFVGLIAPHTARMLGLRSPGQEAQASALLAAAMLVAADWLGRTVIFPWQVPAGLLAAVLGLPAFIWLMRTGRA